MTGQKLSLWIMWQEVIQLIVFAIADQQPTGSFKLCYAEEGPVSSKNILINYPGGLTQSVRREFSRSSAHLPLMSSSESHQEHDDDVVINSPLTSAFFSSPTPSSFSLSSSIFHAKRSNRTFTNHAVIHDIGDGNAALDDDVIDENDDSDSATCSCYVRSSEETRVYMRVHITFYDQASDEAQEQSRCPLLYLVYNGLMQGVGCSNVKSYSLPPLRLSAMEIRLVMSTDSGILWRGLSINIESDSLLLGKCSGRHTTGEVSDILQNKSPFPPPEEYTTEKREDHTVGWPPQFTSHITSELPQRGASIAYPVDDSLSGQFPANSNFGRRLPDDKTISDSTGTDDSDDSRVILVVCLCTGVVVACVLAAVLYIRSIRRDSSQRSRLKKCRPMPYCVTRLADLVSRRHSQHNLPAPSVMTPRRPPRRHENEPKQYTSREGNKKPHSNANATGKMKGKEKKGEAREKRPRNMGMHQSRKRGNEIYDSQITEIDGKPPGVERDITIYDAGGHSRGLIKNDTEIYGRQKVLVGDFVMKNDDQLTAEEIEIYTHGASKDAENEVMQKHRNRTEGCIMGHNNREACHFIDNDVNGFAHLCKNDSGFAIVTLPNVFPESGQGRSKVPPPRCKKEDENIFKKKKDEISRKNMQSNVMSLQPGCQFTSLSTSIYHPQSSVVHEGAGSYECKIENKSPDQNSHKDDSFVYERAKSNAEGDLKREKQDIFNGCNTHVQSVQEEPYYRVRPLSESHLTAMSTRADNRQTQLASTVIQEPECHDCTNRTTYEVAKVCSEMVKNPQSSSKRETKDIRFLSTNTATERIMTQNHDASNGNKDTCKHDKKWTQVHQRKSIDRFSKAAGRYMVKDTNKDNEGMKDFNNQTNVDNTNSLDNEEEDYSRFPFSMGIKNKQTPLRLVERYEIDTCGSVNKRSTEKPYSCASHKIAVPIKPKRRRKHSNTASEWADTQTIFYSREPESFNKTSTIYQTNKDESDAVCVSARNNYCGFYNTAKVQSSPNTFYMAENSKTYREGISDDQLKHDVGTNYPDILRTVSFNNPENSRTMVGASGMATDQVGSKGKSNVDEVEKHGLSTESSQRIEPLAENGNHPELQVLTSTAQPRTFENPDTHPAHLLVILGHYQVPNSQPTMQRSPKLNKGNQECDLSDHEGACAEYLERQRPLVAENELRFSNSAPSSRQHDVPLKRPRLAYGDAICKADVRAEEQNNVKGDSYC